MSSDWLFNYVQDVQNLIIQRKKVQILSGLYSTIVCVGLILNALVMAHCLVRSCAIKILGKIFVMHDLISLNCNCIRIEKNLYLVTVRRDWDVCLTILSNATHNPKSPVSPNFTNSCTLKISNHPGEGILFQLFFCLHKLKRMENREDVSWHYHTSIAHINLILTKNRRQTHQTRVKCSN